jgi:Mrp family chromosome partitioning ATPase
MNTARIIGVAGGSGGVGASVPTAAIAVRAAKAGLRSVVLDGDRLGGDSTSHSASNRRAVLAGLTWKGPGGALTVLRCCGACHPWTA